MEKQAHLEILKEVVYAWLNVQRVEPKREHASFPLALGIKVLYSLGLNHLRGLKGFQARVRIEQVRDEGKIEPWVSGKERRGREVFPAANAFCVVKDLKNQHQHTFEQRMQSDGPHLLRTLREV